MTWGSSNRGYARDRAALSLKRAYRRFRLPLEEPYRKREDNDDGGLTAHLVGPVPSPPAAPRLRAGVVIPYDGHDFRAPRDRVRVPR